MLDVLTHLQATTAILIYVANVPVALTSDDALGDETKASTTREAEVDQVATACRRTADIEANVLEVKRTIKRREQYDNPSITPGG